MTEIIDVHAREILDSRGNPTLECEVAVAAASAHGVPLHRWIGGVNSRTLPVPLMNIVNGGAHADSNVDIQEFMVVPWGAPTFAEALRTGAEIFHALKGVLKARGYSTGVGDEGGFAPSLRSNREALEAIGEAVSKAGYKLGGEVVLALDVAASGLYDKAKGTYQLEGEGRTLSRAELVDFYAQWAEDFPIVSIEDGFAEDDWEGWKMLTERLGERVQL